MWEHRAMNEAEENFSYWVKAYAEDLAKGRDPSEFGMKWIMLIRFGHIALHLVVVISVDLLRSQCNGLPGLCCSLPMRESSAIAAADLGK